MKIHEGELKSVILGDRGPKSWVKRSQGRHVVGVRAEGVTCVHHEAAQTETLVRPGRKFLYFWS